ncbi:MAG: acyltransferase [Sphaerochaetaceae bacterium]|nr:acyltransferase [Sphaerochaetaceae bacterium]
MNFSIIRREFSVKQNYIFYAIFLRFLAAILITNSHYSSVYPISILASGGLLGDVLFFSISGFGLVYIKSNFGKWYLKRTYRIYPAVLLITIIFYFLGFYLIDSSTNGFIGVIQLFIYPTYYHFVASIMILYILYYIVMKVSFLRNNLLWVLLTIIFIQILVYLIFIDKTYYHIDNVREPFIRFIFMEAMIIGAYFRTSKPSFQISKYWLYIITIFLLAMYFVSKVIFVEFVSFSSYQLINQLLLIVLLFDIFYFFSTIESKLRNLPSKIVYFINFIATITLEIYLVQYVIIDKFSYLIFPVNWIIITLLIFVSAFILHITIRYVFYFFDNISNRRESK